MKQLQDFDEDIMNYLEDSKWLVLNKYALSDMAMCLLTMLDPSISGWLDLIDVS